MTRLRPRTVLLVVLGLAAAVALATGTTGPPAGDPLASRPSPTPTAVHTPAPPRLPARELDRQDRPTRRQQAQQRAAQQQHRLLDQLPIKLAGAEIRVAGIAGNRTRLQVRGEHADALLEQALAATGDDVARYRIETSNDAGPRNTTSDCGDQYFSNYANTDAACIATAYAAAAGNYGSATARQQERRSRALATGPLHRAAAAAAGDDTQITVVTDAELVDIDKGSATVALNMTSQRRRGGALIRRAAVYTTQLRHRRHGWRVQAFSVDPGRRP